MEISPASTSEMYLRYVNNLSSQRAQGADGTRRIFNYLQDLG
jgi:hypothetical protein